MSSSAYPLQDSVDSCTLHQVDQLAISQMKLVLRDFKFPVKPRNVSMACSILISQEWAERGQDVRGEELLALGRKRPI